MALDLKLYQKRSIATLARYFDEARISNAATAFANEVEDGLRSEYNPLAGLPEVPYVCLRIPTGGGKTVMGAHIIRVAGRSYLDREYPLVLWLVPTTQIKRQTLEAFKNPRHPYRIELDEAFNGNVAVFDIGEFTQIRPADLGTKVCVVIATVAALRVNDTEGRKVYQHNENLEPHFGGVSSSIEGLERGDNGKALHSFANLLAIHRPLIITDEAHNATTPLSYEVYQRLSPAAVVELTATPDISSSNILVSVSAFELKTEHMIKFPILLKEHHDDWRAAISSAVARRKTLATLAMKEDDFVRPILLVQAENARGAATVEEVKKHLIDDDGVAETAIAIATGDQRELDGVDLFAKDCPIEIVITKQALKEGWDCSFAYIFASVAQVRSDKDVQQLLGRVLRMPYATLRRQDELNRAYAHVVSESFGTAAAELTRSLEQIGFNPLEAASAVRREAEGTGKSGSLELTGGGAVEPEPPVTRMEVSKAPDLESIPEGDSGKIVFTPNDEGRGGVVTVTGEVSESSIDALVAAAAPKKQDEARDTMRRHHVAVMMTKAPSQRGLVFRVPRLCMMEQGELELVDEGAVHEDFAWDPLEYPADLSSLRLKEDSMTFEIKLQDQKVEYKVTKDDAALYLPGFAQDRTISDLLGWLDHEIRETNIRQPVLREWIRQAVNGLTKTGWSLAQLLKAQFVLRRKLEEQLMLGKAKAYKAGFQHTLFGGGAVIETPDDDRYDFVYPADVSQYPARNPYMGSYRFDKHYYPLVGDLRERTGRGDEAEEFQCARVVDLLDEVKFWVRNLVAPNQFWMPTSRQRTYPDFVVELNDGRRLVVEYKGGDRFSNEDSQEKRNVGELWARRSGGRALYVMVQKVDEKGRGMREQILAAIHGDT